MPPHAPATASPPHDTAASPVLLRAQGISKAFPGVRALDDVSITLQAGEVLCVVGENGAGKSTLMKIVGGVYTPDAGQITLDGQPVRLSTVHDAQRAGITLIHQELNLADTLDVAGNIFLGREPTFGAALGLLDRRMYREAEAIAGRVGLTVSPRTLVGRLSIGQQQLVEIARSLSLQARVLIMDEPTSSLTVRDTERLFDVIRDLKEAGVGVLYISHRLPEVQEIADRVTVLRDGRNAGELAREEINHASLVRLMIGRELKQFFVRSHAAARENAAVAKIEVSPASAPRTSPPPASAVALSVTGLRHAAKQRRPIAFEVAAGEIVGVAGLVGSGRTELAQALFGMRRITAGTIKVAGSLTRIHTPRDAIRAGIFLVPEDRRIEGLLLGDTVRHNISLAALDAVSRGGLIMQSRERELAERLCRQLSIRTAGVDKVVGLLSGGNQQKVVLGKWLCRQPRLLILDEPTRGVDVGAKNEIYTLIDELTTRGVGILMISSDLEEILGMSDRVLVMHDFDLAGTLAREELSEESVMNLATGGAP